jgi:polyphosphate glucokinase
MMESEIMAPSDHTSEGARHTISAVRGTNASRVPEQSREQGSPGFSESSIWMNQATMKVLVIDVGGTKVKILATGQTTPRKFASGRYFTPIQMVKVVKEHALDWDYAAVSIGFPGLVGDDGPRSEPGNLGLGWVGFNYAAAFERPIKVINDAAMQALGSYDGGRMLFLGLGTGLGSALISDKVIVPLELGRLRYRRGPTLGELLGRRGLRRLGKTAWRLVVDEVASMLTIAFAADYTVIGGGNAKRVKTLPPGVRLGHNLTAFRGGLRLWNAKEIPTLTVDAVGTLSPAARSEWRMI